MSVGVGSEIAGYRTLRRIGEGGMSVVYLVERGDRAGQLCLKVLREEIAKDDDFRRRFLRESGYAASFEHPNVVQVRDAGESDGVLYIAMDYVEGSDLYTLLATGPLEPRRALSLLTQVAAGLDAAHAAGLLHRDVKPGNILVAAGSAEAAADHCYLTDFGLGKHATKDSVALTTPGSFVGTILYTAPEQVLGKELDARADVYSLGCLVYECLAGRPPYSSPTDAGIMQAHIQADPPRLSETQPDLPVELDEVIVRALSKEPGERYTSCGELMEAAWTALGGQAQSDGGTTLKLKVTAGAAVGTEILVEDEFVIGRLAEGDGNLGSDIELSREHAKIAPTPSGEWRIEDLGSTNGTMVNGRRIGVPEILYPGDQIEMGGTTLVVQVSAPAPPSPEVVEAGSDEIPQTDVPETIAVEPAETAPKHLSLRIEIDLESGEASLELDESSDPVKLVHEDGRWRLA